MSLGAANIILLSFIAGCGTIAKTKPNIGVYMGQPLIYLYPGVKVKEACKQVLAEQKYMVVSEESNKIRAIRHATFWRSKASDVVITFTELQPDSTRIDILSQTDFEILEFGLQDIYVKDFLKALRKKLQP
jgi:hypothetical protein